MLNLLGGLRYAVRQFRQSPVFAGAAVLTVALGTFWDPQALTIAAGSLALCAFVAAMIPAGRAASISPMHALRSE